LANNILFSRNYIVCSVILGYYQHTHMQPVFNRPMHHWTLHFYSQPVIPLCKFLLEVTLLLISFCSRELWQNKCHQITLTF